MLMHGSRTLSDSELIAILLGSGVPGKNAIELARELLQSGMSKLARREAKSLVKTCGVGVAKAARIAAAFEIAQRYSNLVPEEPPPFDADLVARKLVSAYSHHAQERLGAAFVDSRRRLVDCREIYVGTVNTALVSTRDIIRHALDERATAIMLYHNHPSGSVVPSDEDMKFTKKLKQVLDLMDIELIDHLVIGAHGYYSMKEKGHI